MYSTTLQQPPLLVLPLVRQNLIVSQCPGVFEEETPMDANRASHLHDMAAFLRKEPYCLSEAADDLEGVHQCQTFLQHHGWRNNSQRQLKP